MEDDKWTVEQIVGYRVGKARERRDLSQAELGREMTTYMGKPWSRQTVSVAEKGGRAFTAAELVALAYELRVPIESFFKPPAEVRGVRVSKAGALRRDDLAEQTLPVDLSAEVRSDMQEVIAKLRQLDNADERNADTRRKLHETLEAQLDEDYSE